MVRIHSGVPLNPSKAGDANPKWQLGRPEAQPPAPAVERRGYRPLGPGDCMLHSSAQRCQRCGATGKPVHMLIRLISGFFCEKCCPACHPGGWNSGALDAHSLGYRWRSAWQPGGLASRPRKRRRARRARRRSQQRERVAWRVRRAALDAPRRLSAPGEGRRGQFGFAGLPPPSGLENARAPWHSTATKAAAGTRHKCSEQLSHSGATFIGLPALPGLADLRRAVRRRRGLFHHRWAARPAPYCPRERPPLRRPSVRRARRQWQPREEVHWDRGRRLWWRSPGFRAYWRRTGARW